MATVKRLEAVIIRDPQLAGQPCQFPPEDARGNETELRMDETDTAPDSEKPAFLFPLRFLSAECFAEILRQVAGAVGLRSILGNRLHFLISGWAHVTDTRKIDVWGLDCRLL